MLVKFSGADASPAVRRWADLLTAEHLALECAALLPGLQSARSRVVAHEGRTFLETAPWMSIFPGLAIALTVLAFNLLGDCLRDAFDPTLS